MNRKFTLTKTEQLLSIDSDQKMITVYPKASTLNFIRQFAYAYHSERSLPSPLDGMILN